ncbi:hypothetical protein NGRA_1214 [Nosema granulosis]|uniref:Uncharacterized protein n=1 Tax=Nosema granulosis TaxID=83296 RepID=A0A9P6KZL0_9MICR|nr:hypothetical protein NGRA_1214 [Nosema granulosis]
MFFLNFFISLIFGNESDGERYYEEYTRERINEIKNADDFSYTTSSTSTLSENDPIYQNSLPVFKESTYLNMNSSNLSKSESTYIEMKNSDGESPYPTIEGQKKNKFSQTNPLPSKPDSFTYELEIPTTLLKSNQSKQLTINLLFKDCKCKEEEPIYETLRDGGYSKNVISSNRNFSDGTLRRIRKSIRKRISTVQNN